MTAKEQLLEQVMKLSESEADETLRLLAERQDPLVRLLEDAPLEDEEISAEEEAAVAEGRADIAAGRTVSLAEAMRESE
jgi:predicted transcriptional regulator